MKAMMKFIKNLWTAYCNNMYEAYKPMYDAGMIHN